MKLLLRSASHKHADFLVECLPELKSIWDLKRHLQQIYPEKPDASFQRIIYRGQLLQDNKCLSEVFQQISAEDLDPIVVHLVCLPKIDTTPTDSTPPISSGGFSTSVSSNPGVSSASTPSTSTSTTPLTTPTNIPTPLLSAAPFLPSNAQLNFAESMRVSPSSANYLYANYYHAWLAYLMAIRANANGQQRVALSGGINPTDLAQLFAQQQQFGQLGAGEFLLRHRAPVPDGQQAAQQPQQQAANANENNDNRGLNNAGVGQLFGDDEEEEGRARDFLDWAYVAVRAGILVSLILLYSSAARFALFTAFLVAIWLLKAAIGGFELNRPAAPRQEGAADPPQQGPPLQQQQQQPVDAQPAAPAPPESSPPVDNPPPPPQPSMLKTIVTAIAVFFVSLFPDIQGQER